MTVYTQNLHLQRCVCVCVCVCVSISGARSFFVVGVPLPWAQAAPEKKKKWSSTIALMLWCLQGGVRAAELPAERAETYASVPLTAQISVSDRLRLTRANTRAVMGETFTRRRSDNNTLGDTDAATKKTPQKTLLSDAELLILKNSASGWCWFTWTDGGKKMNEFCSGSRKHSVPVGLWNRRMTSYVRDGKKKKTIHTTAVNYVKMWEFPPLLGCKNAITKQIWC